MAASQSAIRTSSRYGLFAWRDVARVVLPLVALATLSCSGESAGPADPTVGRPGLTVAPASGTSRAERFDYNAQLARLGDEIPGFGGMYRENGRLVVLLKGNASRLDDAKQAIGNFRSQAVRGSAIIAEHRRQEVNSMISRPADYTFRELYGWYGELRRPLWTIHGVWWTDIDERANRIKIGVQESSASSAVMTLVSDLRIPRAAVEVVLDPGSVQPDVLYLSGTVSPRAAGIQIDIESEICSMAFSADRSNDADWYFVTAAHCTTQYASVNGDDVGQPTLGTSMAVEVSDPSLFTHAADTVCPEGFDCRWSEVAMFRYSDWDFGHGYVAWPPLGDTAFTSSVPLYAAFDYVGVGDTVYLVGRTSGRTAGEVTATCLTKTAPYAGQKQLCYWEADYDRAGGDSGGPVVWAYDDLLYAAVGVHSSGNTSNGRGLYSTTYTWMDEIEDDYGETYCLDTSCAPDPVVSIAHGPETVPDTEAECEWNASVTQGIPPYTFTWSGVASGSGEDLFASVSGEGWLYVLVEDGNENQDQASLYITIDSEAEPEECLYQ